jgi:hypothetical protein
MSNPLVVFDSGYTRHDDTVSDSSGSEEYREPSYFRDSTGIKPIESIDDIRRDNNDELALRRAIRSVTQSSKAYRQLPDRLKTNKEVLCALVHAHPHAVRVLKGDQQKDLDILWHAIYSEPNILCRLDPFVLDNKSMVTFAFFKAVERNTRFDLLPFYSKDISFFMELGHKTKQYFYCEPHNINSALSLLARGITRPTFYEDDDFAAMYFEHARASAMVEIYTHNLSANSKRSGRIVKALADKNFIRQGDEQTAVNIPEYVWSDRDAMTTLISSHGILFPKVSPSLRSDGQFVSDAIRFNCSSKDAIYEIVVGACGPLRLIQSEFLAHVVKPLGYYLSSNSSIRNDLFDGYKRFFNCEDFTKDCIYFFLKKQPSLLIKVLSYPGMENFLGDIKNVAIIGALTTGTIHDKQLDVKLTRALLSHVHGRVDIYTAKNMLFVEDRRHTHRRAESVVEMMRAMLPQLRSDVLAAIESFGDRTSMELQDPDPITHFGHEDGDPVDYENAVKIMARDIVEKISITDTSLPITISAHSTSPLVDYLLKDCTLSQKEKRVAALMKGGSHGSQVYQSLEDKSIFGSSAYLRSLSYKAKDGATTVVYKDHATQAEKDDPSLFLSFMTEEGFASSIAEVANDIVKQHPDVVRRSMLMFGRGLDLADGHTPADLPESLWWTVEKRLLLIAYMNHHYRNDTSEHILFLRSLYYDLFEFDATEAERSTRALLPKRGKMPAHYQNVLPQRDITNIGDRRERSEMINAWSNAVSEISRGLKMVESRHGKSKTTTVSTIDDRMCDASVTITKLCDKINNFLCRTTGQAQVMDMMSDMFDVEDEGGDELFQVQQQTAIDTYKELNKKKKKRPASHTSHGRGKKSSGISTSALLPSEDEDDF